MFSYIWISDKQVILWYKCTPCKKIFIVYLKFKCNWSSCILSCNILPPAILKPHSFRGGPHGCSLWTELLPLTTAFSFPWFVTPTPQREVKSGKSSISLHLESLLPSITKPWSPPVPILSDRILHTGVSWPLPLTQPPRGAQDHQTHLYLCNVCVTYYSVCSGSFPLGSHSSIPCVSRGTDPFLLSPRGVT